MTNTPNKSAEKFWDELYARHNRIWSGRANVPLVNAVESLQPGTALDLGCGEGGDAVWLAQHGWQVTATDVSTVALARANQLAAEQGVQDRIDFQQHNFAIGFPTGMYDLVSAQYLQSPLEDFQRTKVLQKAAAVVAPGGLLLIVEHAAAPPWSDHVHDHFPTPQETFDSLVLDSMQWQAKLVDALDRHTVGPDGKKATIKDNVIIVRRRKV